MTNNFEGMTGVHRADAALDVGRPRDALKIAHDVLSTEPQNADAFLVAARAHLALDEFGWQLEAANAALALRPQSYQGLVLAGAALWNLSRNDEAAGVFRRAVEVAPDLWPAHTYLGLVLADEGSNRVSKAQAWDCVRRAVELAPAESTTHAAVGQVAMARKDYTTAEAALRRSLELDPQDAQALNSLAVLLGKTGRNREAAAEFGATLALDPQQAEARSNLDWLTTKTIQRLHFTMFIGLFIAVRTVSSSDGGRVVAGGVAVIAILVAVWTVWRNHHGLPAGVTAYMRTFPRREPLRAAWGGCCLVAFLALLGCIVLPVGAAYAGCVIGYVALAIGCVLSWIAAGRDRRLHR